MTERRTEPTSDRLDGDLGWVLGVLFRSYVKAADVVLGDLPGGSRGYQVLTAAVARTPRNQGSIADQLGIDRTVLTYLIDDLDRRELLTRQPDPLDRRSRLVVATDTGRALWLRHREGLQHAESHVLQGLKPADAATFRTLATHLACAAQALDPVTDLCQVVTQVRNGP